MNKPKRFFVANLMPLLNQISILAIVMLTCVSARAQEETPEVEADTASQAAGEKLEVKNLKVDDVAPILDATPAIPIQLPATWQNDLVKQIEEIVKSALSDPALRAQTRDTDPAELPTGVQKPLSNQPIKPRDRTGADFSTSTDNDGARTIVIKGPAPIPDPPVFYSTIVRAAAKVGVQQIDQSIDVTVKVVQGRAETISLGLIGTASVIDVAGKHLKSWAVRQVGKERFLDLTLTAGIQEVNAKVTLRSQKHDLKQPVAIQLTHFTRGDSLGFDSTVDLQFASDIEGTATEIQGFVALGSNERGLSFQSATGGKLAFTLNRSDASAKPVELSNATLTGQLHSNGDSIQFQFQTTVQVNEPNSEIMILTGNAAVTKVPQDDNFRLKLTIEGEKKVYKIQFPHPGTFPISLDFVAAVTGSPSEGREIDFTIGASAVVPVKLSGLDAHLDFHRDQAFVVPIRSEDDWTGFLPATGRTRLRWKMAQKQGEGQLFFSTSGQIDTTVGAGLLRQQHQIDYQVLQGQLKSIRILLQGPGEILDVQGPKIVAWKVIQQGDDRMLEATLSQPITGTSQILIRSQTSLDPFPVKVAGLRLTPEGAIRHSGYLRIANSGSVRIEPTSLVGLTQLAPEKFPGEEIKARQTYVYRFPAADHSFAIAADRIEPEVNISQLVLYQLSETDRIIKADIELDIRDAAIREWDFDIPADYSVVAVTGASVADYISASTAEGGRRRLKVVFNKETAGRQLVSLQLEKSEIAAEGEWALQRLEFPGAETVRGAIGIMSAAGFRVAVGQTDLLVEKPLSYFPKQKAQLQQAFRIREPNWSATMNIEMLDRSVQSDVFHLYSLSQETVYGSALINYFVTGAPVSEWKLSVPASTGNVMVDGQNIRTWRREADTVIVSLHQPVMGPHTLLVTFEEKPDKTKSTFLAGQIEPLDVQGERGYVQVVSPMQVEIETVSMSDHLLKLDPLELPAEFRLLSTAPALGTWQYTDRPFELDLKVQWFEPGTTVTQVVEFSEANSRVSQDGELVTDVLYYVKSRGRRTLRLKMPDGPVRLWAVSVNGQPVTARKADDATLIPLPGGTDPNVPIAVSLRLGKPTVSQSSAILSLPVVDAPVLKTQWEVTGDENYVLVPTGGTVSPPIPVLRPSGFQWVANNGITSLCVIALLTLVGAWARHKSNWWRLAGLLSLGIAIWTSILAASQAVDQKDQLQPLHLSLPILSAGEAAELHVTNMPLWQADLSWLGLVSLFAGIALNVWSFLQRDPSLKSLIRGASALLISLGILSQSASGHWFFGLLALTILLALFVRPAFNGFRDLGRWIGRLLTRWKAHRKTKPEQASSATGAASGAATSVIAFLALAVSASSAAAAEIPGSFQTADSITQQWKVTHRDARLTATGIIELTGEPGDQFIMLKAPAVLTAFEGEGLRLTRNAISDSGLTYVINILPPGTDDSSAPLGSRTYKATFEYQLEAIDVSKGIPMLTGDAAVQRINLHYDEPRWTISGSTAMRIEYGDSDSRSTTATILLGPGSGGLRLKPIARDVASETTQFYVEAANLYLPGPGVIDGRHRLDIRTSQGQVDELNVDVPTGLTVSSVSGPVGAWQFDADTGSLKMQIEPAQSKAFAVMIETQRGFDPLPANVNLAPLTVADANGEIGLIAIAFGQEAQPETLTPDNLSTVNPGDFDASLMPGNGAILHRVYRYGAAGGNLDVRVAPVASEVRVSSKQVLSLGDERVVLAVNFSADISRAGLFQLSFPLPEGLEVESLTGPALHHWAELSEDGTRQIILHLNGKTIGTQKFSLSLSGTSPTDVAEWTFPRFELNEAARQSGELVVRPTTGIRLRTVRRQNVSETDPRTLGDNSKGSLAFRLLQRDWNLVLGIEKLDPWITGQVLHEVTLREGQTRSALFAEITVQNASIRALRVALPIDREDEIRTLRASGSTVSDLIRTAPDSNIWEVQFKRRVVGRIQFRIEYERRGDREDAEENLSPAELPDARQLSYYFGVRAGGRLELGSDELTAGWQRVDWTAVPQRLREAENRSTPALVFRAVTPEAELRIQAKRHSLADALKLRVAKGSLTTILSPSGDQLTSVDVAMEVIQRSSLSVGLPKGGQLISIFVNGESVNSIRQRDGSNAWQFHILPGIDDRTAQVRFVYSLPGSELSSLQLTSPKLNVPLENIEWNVIAPKGFVLSDNDGNLELIGQVNQKNYDRDSYLSKANRRRQLQAQRATLLLEQANQLLQTGEQGKARWALNSVANQYALDAASNEDARVQLENLHTQQAIVGLNTRRQRLFLDNNRDANDFSANQQLRQAAVDNPILQQDQLNFRPQQLSQLLGGNTTADNAILQRIASRLVQHQHTTDTAPQAIIISLPEEGDIYKFARSVQVAENAPLELDLDFSSKITLDRWRIALLLTMLVGLGATLAIATVRPGSPIRNKAQH